MIDRFIKRLIPFAVTIVILDLYNMYFLPRPLINEAEAIELALEKR